LLLPRGERPGYASTAPAPRPQQRRWPFKTRPTAALETSLTGTFRLTVRRDLGYTHPFAESPMHLISIGLDADLDAAARQAVREMIDHICRRTSLARDEAHMLCSHADDLRVTQNVDGNIGCHIMLAKSCL
jgi:acetamidase/formamidase